MSPLTEPATATSAWSGSPPHAVLLEIAIRRSGPVHTQLVLVVAPRSPPGRSDKAAIPGPRRLIARVLARGAGHPYTPTVWGGRPTRSSGTSTAVLLRSPRVLRIRAATTGESSSKDENSARVRMSTCIGVAAITVAV